MVGVAAFVFVTFLLQSQLHVTIFAGVTVHLLDGRPSFSQFLNDDVTSLTPKLKNATKCSAPTKRLVETMNDDQ